MQDKIEYHFKTHWKIIQWFIMIQSIVGFGIIIVPTFISIAVPSIKSLVINTLLPLGMLMEFQGFVYCVILITVDSELQIAQQRSARSHQNVVLE